MKYNPRLKPMSQAQARALQLLNLQQSSDLPQDTYWNAAKTLEKHGYPITGIPDYMTWHEAKHLSDYILVELLNDERLIILREREKYIEKLRKRYGRKKNVSEIT